MAIFKGLKLDGKKGKFTLKVTMKDGTIEHLEFDKNPDVKTALQRCKEAGYHARITEN